MVFSHSRVSITNTDSILYHPLGQAATERLPDYTHIQWSCLKHNQVGSEGGLGIQVYMVRSQEHFSLRLNSIVLGINRFRKSKKTTQSLCHLYKKATVIKNIKELLSAAADMKRKLELEDTSMNYLKK